LDLETLTDSHVFSTRVYEKVVLFGMSLWIDGRMAVLLGPTRWNEFYSVSEFKFIDHRPVAGKCEQSSSKNKGPLPGPQNQNCNFLENDICELQISIENGFTGQQDFIFCSVISNQQWTTV
jgi:hypothetical protein